MKIGIDGSCLSNRRGFGRFRPAALGALAKQPATTISRSSSIGRRRRRSRFPPPFESRGRRRGRSPEPGGVGPGPAALARHDRHGTGRRPVRDRPDVLPGHLQLLPGLERAQAGRDHARHAAAHPPGAGFSQRERAAGVAAQGGGRGALGRPDRDRLRGLAQGHPGLVRLARRQDPGDHRRPRPDLSTSRPASPQADAVLRRFANSARRRAICFMSAA